MPERLRETFRKRGNIPAWLLTTREYRDMISDAKTWKRRIALDGSFAFFPRCPERNAEKEARVEANHE